MTEKYKLFKDLLAAAFNIGPHAEPGDARGAAVNETADVAAAALFGFADAEPGSLDGTLVAARLFVEVFTQADPVAYMRAEIEKGRAGKRHQFDTVTP